MGIPSRGVPTHVVCRYLVLLFRFLIQLRFFTKIILKKKYVLTGFLIYLDFFKSKLTFDKS
jgi:hypothetical protein